MQGLIYHKANSTNKKIIQKVTTTKVKETSDTEIYLKVRIHEESYVLIEELTKSRVSLKHFLSQVVTKTDLELLTITKGNTNFPSLTTQSNSSRATSNYPRVKKCEDEDSTTEMSLRR
jgi:hypothetical protein